MSVFMTLCTLGTSSVINHNLFLIIILHEHMAITYTSNKHRNINTPDLKIPLTKSYHIHVHVQEFWYTSYRMKARVL